jgi:CHAT domain-containing protein
VPESERQRLADDKIKRLVVVPDGALALFPFETCVVSTDGEVRYLLDVAPPINYAPSATILMRLAERPPEPAPKGIDPVLALGDPAYLSATALEQAGRNAATGSITARYAGFGGSLSRLPYSGREANWVAENFTKRGLKAGVLRDSTATEAAVRKYAPGRRVLHLACHGLVDVSYGSFFGALALAPGPRGQVDPSDNGFLTLSEMYALDLRTCELAILSACQTNYGEHQAGEGVWALTRGFLVAGARRVVASDWLVDDEAAASLVSYYTAILAQQEREGKTPDYAAALAEAKRWVRGQEKWQSPYFWGTFVLVGTN